MCPKRQGDDEGPGVEAARVRDGEVAACKRALSHSDGGVMVTRLRGREMGVRVCALARG